MPLLVQLVLMVTIWLTIQLAPLVAMMDITSMEDTVWFVPRDVLLARMRTYAYSLMRVTSSKRTEQWCVNVQLDNTVSTENAPHVTQFVPHALDHQPSNAQDV